MGNRLSGPSPSSAWIGSNTRTSTQPTLLLRSLYRWHWNFREQSRGSQTDVDWLELETLNNSVRTGNTKWGQVLAHPWPHDKSQQWGRSWAKTQLQASKQRNHTISSHSQPSTTKRAMVNAELLRAETYQTFEFVQTAVNQTRSKLLNNDIDYLATWTSPAQRQNKKIRSDIESLFTLNIPFLSGSFNYKAGHALLGQNHVFARLVNPRGRTLLHLTKPNMTTPETCKSIICPAKEIC